MRRMRHWHCLSLASLLYRLFPCSLTVRFREEQVSRCMYRMWAGL